MENLTVGRAIPLQDYNPKNLPTHVKQFVSFSTKATSNTTLSVPTEVLRSPQKRLDVVMRHIARNICAAQYRCDYNHPYVDCNWKEFMPAAKAAYDAIIEVDAGHI